MSAETVWKESLLLGKVVHPRTKERYEFTREHVRQARDNLKKMLARGRVVPACFEHQSDVEVMSPDEWRAHLAKNVFGRALDARIATDDDVRSGLARQRGSLLIKLSILDPDNARRVKRAGFVSPKLFPGGYVDSDGTVYTGATIAHLAGTPHPVQYKQAPFEMSTDAALYLSHLRMEKTVRNDDDTDDTETDDDTETEGGTDWFAQLEDALRVIGVDIPADAQDLKVSDLVKAIKSSAAYRNASSETTAPAGGAPMMMSTLANRALRKSPTAGIKAAVRDAINGARRLSAK